VKDILDPAPLAAKFAAFGWEVVEINGHDMNAVLPALKRARNERKGKPVCVIADTIKGKGVSFMENNPDWHGVAPKPDQVAAALKELEAN